MTCARFDRLARFEGKLRTQGADQNYVLPTDDQVESGRIAIYANALAPGFDHPARLVVRLDRATLAEPLFLGFSTLGQSPLDQDDDSEAAAVVVLAGFGRDETTTRLLFVVGK